MPTHAHIHKHTTQARTHARIHTHKDLLTYILTTPQRPIELIRVQGSMHAHKFCFLSLKHILRFINAYIRSYKQTNKQTNMNTYTQIYMQANIEYIQTYVDAYTYIPVHRQTSAARPATDSRCYSSSTGFLFLPAQLAPRSERRRVRRCRPLRSTHKRHRQLLIYVVCMVAGCPAFSDAPFHRTYTSSCTNCPEFLNP